MKNEILTTGEVYHVFSRSIAGFKIFNADNNYQRIIGALKFYQNKNQSTSYSKFIDLSRNKKGKKGNKIIDKSEILTQIIAFCIMPTHIHLILKQLKDGGISKFMGNILNSYTRYFNTLYQRKGPLWETKFKKILVSDDDQLLHLTRYIHLNPTSAGLVQRPENWKYSSYREYINRKNTILINRICDYRDILNIVPREYKEFVEERIDYQKEISLIKVLSIDGYTG